MAEDIESIAVDLSPSAKMLFANLRGDIGSLRGEVTRLAVEFRSIAESLLVIKTQDVAARVNRIEEVTIPAIRERQESQEKFQVRVLTAVTVVNGLLVVAGAIVAIWAKLK